MRLQIWYFEDIENILWASQTVGQASTTIAIGNGRPAAYHAGFRKGFEMALGHTAELFNDKQEIWSREHILSILLATQTTMQTTAKTLPDRTKVVAYQQGFNQGFEVALWCAATAFGVSLLSVGNDSLPKRTPGVPCNPDPWFQEDIQNILLAMRMMMQNNLDNSKQLAKPMAYNDGFEAALRHIARSFGIRLLSAHFSVPQKDVRFWPRQEIKHKLNMTYQTIPLIAPQTKSNAELVAYWQGFKATLKGVSTAFGITGVIQIQ